MKVITDLQIGKAGEYLVCADLILNGYVAFLSEQGLPFDIVLDYNNKLYKVQVKTTRNAKNILQRSSNIPAYIYHIGTNGNKQKRKKYEIGNVDIFALVALDSKRIAYLPYFDTQTTMNFRIPEFRGNYSDEQGMKKKKEVIELKQKGMSCYDIANKLNMTLSNVYKYSANVSIEQKGSKSGIYFDELTLEKCLQKLKI